MSLALTCCLGGGQDGNIVGLQALLALHDGEFHLLPALQRTETFPPDGTVMHEDVVAFRSLDEAIPLSGIEPLHHTSLTLSHSQPTSNATDSIKASTTSTACK